MKTHNTHLQLPESAAEAIKQLQSRKEGLRALLPVGYFPFEEKHAADCRSVPCGMGSGTSFINQAITEIDANIAEIIKICLVDRNWQ